MPPRTPRAKLADMSVLLITYTRGAMKERVYGWHYTFLDAHLVILQFIGHYTPCYHGSQHGYHTCYHWDEDQDIHMHVWYSKIEE